MRTTLSRYFEIENVKRHADITSKKWYNFIVGNIREITIAAAEKHNISSIEVEDYFLDHNEFSERCDRKLADKIITGFNQAMISFGAPEGAWEEVAKEMFAA